ncbi:hypothetical protein [Rhodococcus ruber]|uniref:hypothetical protein n=1 Tax=Rhodococcus ruber TaxID=1830 RepID=UPI001120AF48|nr:hypothetical protein [Rhodococcus ruber]QDC17389.1 hypothetical protein E2561_24725 [Rhodococcus ruber]
MSGRSGSLVAGALVWGMLALAAPAHGAPPPAAPPAAAPGGADRTAAAPDPALLAAYRHGVPIVEAVRAVFEDETTIGVVYRTVQDPAQLASATDKYVVTVGVPPAPEFLVLTHPVNAGTMYSLDGAGRRHDQLSGRFTRLPALAPPGSAPAVGAAQITD